MKEYKYEERTVGNILDDKARTIGEKVYFLHGDQKVTYREMNENANRVANSLINLGIKKGDKVCVIMANSIEFVYTWFALAKIGAVMVPMNIALKGNLLRHIIQNSDASVVIVDRDLVDRVVFIQEEIKKVKTIIIVPDYSEKEIGFTSDFAIKKFIQLRDGSPKTPASDVHFYDPMSILYTSGTTGPSKGAILSHGYHYCRSKQGKAVPAIHRRTVWFTPAFPFFTPMLLWRL